MLTAEEKEKYRLEQIKYRKTYFSSDNDVIKIVFKSARKAKNCPFCSAKRKKIILEKPTTFYEEEEGKGSRRITPIEILERLKKISDVDHRILGISPENARLEWVIFTVLPIPPVCARPSITLDSGIRSEDDLTHKLVDVIRINQRLRENIDAGAPHLIVEDLWELLQYHFTTYINNQITGIPPARHRSGRAYQTLTGRLTGKEGRFRKNLSGKRVDFSARSVISPNPYLSINEVGVPIEVAKILTISTNVNDWNIEELKQMIIDGPFKHPGANAIVRNDRRRIDLRYVKNRKIIADMLTPGFTVERHLNDGDLVLFNRQPSLHRMSIMAHEVKIMDGRTFRLNLTVCPPYNADFDGDEMNIHVPQSEGARAEAELLLKVQENIVSPKTGNVLIGGIQDFISSIYQFTKDDSLYNRIDTLKLLYLGNVFDTNLEFSLDQLTPMVKDPEPMYSGKQIFSTLLPQNLNYLTKSNSCKKCNRCEKQACPHKAYLLIENGIMKCGNFDQKAYGVIEPNNIVKNIIKNYGNTQARKFIDNSSKMLLYILRKNGLTLGLDEMTFTKEGGMKIQEILISMKNQVEKLIKDFFEKNKSLNRNDLQREWKKSKETKIKNILKKVRNDALKVNYNYIKENSHLGVMIKSGARGSLLKFGQMGTMLGQQIIRHERIFRGYNFRTLPHFKINDFTPKSRGFVTSSLRDGLKPTEFFYHAMAGRDGLVDREIRTFKSGYFQRRLINSLIDLYVENDGTVRNSDGNIIQFKYGGDNVSPQMTDSGKIMDLDDLILKIKTSKLVKN